MKYTSPTTPMAHQTEALRRRALRPPGYADAFADLIDMGGGKSKIVLDEWQQMLSSGTISDLLVVAPAGSIRNWYEDKSDDQPSELKRHLDSKLLKTLKFAGWGRGVAARKSCHDLLKIKSKPRALFVNVEAISTSEEATKLCAEFLKSGACLFAIDESTVIRAQKSERTKRIVRTLAPFAKARRILTGLVAPKNPLDLFWQFYFLDPKILGYDSFTVFRSRYAKVKRTCFEPNKVIRGVLRKAMGLKSKNVSDAFMREKLNLVYEGKRNVSKLSRREILTELEIAAEGMPREAAVECILRLGGWIQSTPKIEEFRNLDELQAKIAPFSYRVLKEDCLDLPPKVYGTRDVELTDEQARMYQEILKHACTELEGQHVVARNVIAQMLRLHQVALGHCADDEKKVFDIPSNRIDALLEVLEDHSGAAIIWSSYRREIDKIVSRLKKEYGSNSVAAYHGGNQGARDVEERRFLSGEARFMVSTQAAGGKGNTWTVADLTVYCSNSYDLEHRLQSEDRNHRKGQKKSVTYIDLICRGTVEERIIKALRQKIDLSTAITGENYREWLI